MLPFHRRDRQRASRESRGAARTTNGVATTSDKATASSPRDGGSTFSQLIRFVIYWIKVSWKDVLAMAVLGAAALSIYKAPYAATRNFPITFNGSGDIVYPQFAYPERGWIISPSLSGVISAVIPIGIILLAQIRIRSFWDFNNAILGLLYSLILGSLFQVIIKQLIGGFRPYFLAVCQPDISLARNHNETGLNGVGFQSIMYTSEVCTNPDKQALKNAMTSFPSGHATSAFAGYVFLFLWMNAKLKVWSNFQASFYWLAALCAPLLGATLMAAALTVDQAHNWYDILAGIVIGTVAAFMSYRVCYAAVWDWRYNHIPLKRTKVFDYAAGLVPEDMAKATFVKKLGWGRRSRRYHHGKRASRGAGSARSSATYARNGSQVSPHSRGAPLGVGGAGVAHPDPATVRPMGQYYARGDEMV